MRASGQDRSGGHDRRDRSLGRSGLIWLAPASGGARRPEPTARHEMLGAVSVQLASPQFVGRGPELARLDELIRAAAGGEPGFALIGGEAGVGKSRLMEEFAARALQTGGRVLVGDCVDLGDAELPYAPLVGALRAVGADELAAVLGRGVSDLAPLLPQLEPSEAVSVPTSLAQGRLF